MCFRYNFFFFNLYDEMKKLSQNMLSCVSKMHRKTCATTTSCRDEGPTNRNKTTNKQIDITHADELQSNERGRYCNSKPTHIHTTQSTNSTAQLPESCSNNYTQKNDKYVYTYVFSLSANAHDSFGALYSLLARHRILLSRAQNACVYVCRYTLIYT